MLSRSENSRLVVGAHDVWWCHYRGLLHGPLTRNVSLHVCLHFPFGEKVHWIGTGSVFFFASSSSFSGQSIFLTRTQFVSSCDSLTITADWDRESFLLQFVRCRKTPNTMVCWMPFAQRPDCVVSNQLRDLSAAVASSRSDCTVCFTYSSVALFAAAHKSWSQLQTVVHTKQ